MVKRRRLASRSAASVEAIRPHRQCFRLQLGKVKALGDMVDVEVDIESR